MQLWVVWEGLGRWGMTRVWIGQGRCDGNAESIDEWEGRRPAIGRLQLIYAGLFCLCTCVAAIELVTYLICRILQKRTKFTRLLLCKFMYICIPLVQLPKFRARGPFAFLSHAHLSFIHVVLRPGPPFHIRRRSCDSKSAFTSNLFFQSLLPFIETDAAR
jgi:hypothetical protein